MPAQSRIAFVVGTTTGGTGAHVRMLAAGCAARGAAVTVLGPASAATAVGLASLPGVTFLQVEFGDRPHPGDAMAVRRLRSAFRGVRSLDVETPDVETPNSESLDVETLDVVHAHGMRAGALSVLALVGARRRRRRPALVVTVHNAPPPGRGAAALVYRLLERIVARGADLVLCVSGDLDRRMRVAGARRVERALVPAPAGTTASAGSPGALAQAETRVSGPGPDGAGVLPARSAGRPVVLAAGRLAAQKDFGTLLAAAASWRDLDPAPLLMIAGDGPLGAQLRAQAAALGVDAEFAGHRDDVPALLAAAAVFVLPSRWEGQPLVLQEALRAGAPIVASLAGGIPDLTGADAALLVPPGDVAALADAVRAVLTDQSLAARLRAAARDRAATLPTEDDAMQTVLAGYATLR